MIGTRAAWMCRTSMSSSDETECLADFRGHDTQHSGFAQMLVMLKDELGLLLPSSLPAEDVKLPEDKGPVCRQPAGGLGY